MPLAESFGSSVVVRQAERLVNSLYASAMLRSDVLANLRDDSTLREPVRRPAPALAQQFPENARSLDNESCAWQVLPVPIRKRMTGASARGSRLPARAARRELSQHPGAVQYRVGKYHEAVATLTESEPLNAAIHDGPLPEDLAFLALARYRLGQTDQARTLSRLREAMKNPKWAEDDPEAQIIALEAETIELDLAFPADPFVR